MIRVFSSALTNTKVDLGPRIGNECSLSDILEKQPDPKYFLSLATTLKILKSSGKMCLTPLMPITTKVRTTSPTEEDSSFASSISQYIQTIGYIHRKELRRHLIRCKEGVDNLLLHLCEMGLIRIRRLTPLECERLQGFPEFWTKYQTRKDINVAETPSQ